MDIQFRTYQVLPVLKGNIHKIWSFESPAPMPADDMKLVVPNGRLLMVIPFRNGLVGKMNNKLHLANTNQIALVGMSGHPSIVDAANDGPVGTVGVEFTAAGAYRFFHFNLSDISNQLQYLTNLLPGQARRLEEKLQEVQLVEGKVNILQRFLFSLYQRTEKDSLFEYCVEQMIRTAGGIRVNELERQTGYSSRWLNMKFGSRLGMSPKNLSSIIRFQRHYQAMMANPVHFFNHKHFFDHYHDESHFIKNFKRYTGFAPSRIIQLKNEFGKAFYRN
jgi:AraC-type DNA-binding domain-containing proteins